MVDLNLPAIGQSSWGDEVLDSFNEIETWINTTAPATYVAAVVLAGAGIDSTGATSSHAAINALIAAAPVGSTYYLPTGTYQLGAPILLNKAGGTLTGPGVLKAASGVETFLVNVTADDVTVSGVECDGNRATMTGHPTHDGHDLIRVTGDRARIVGCYLHDGWGGGVTLLGAADCEIVGNKVRTVYDNGILVANAGADRNIVVYNDIDGTTGQNGIFITASSGSIATADYVYDNHVAHNIVRGCADSGIESGIHSVRTIIEANTVRVDENPGVLLRDSIGVQVVNNTLVVSATANEDAISVVPQTEADSWNSTATIKGNHVTGSAIRSAVYVGQAGVRVVDNHLEQTAATVNSDGTGATGKGVLLAAVGQCAVVGNRISGYSYGVDANYAAGAGSVADLTIIGNDIDRCLEGISVYYLTLTRSEIRDNRVTRFGNRPLVVDNSTGGGSTVVRGNTFAPYGFAGSSTVTYPTGYKVITDAGSEAVRAYRSAALNIPSGAWTVIPLDGESFDTGGFHDLVTNPSRLTVPAGKGGRAYHVKAVARMVALNATGDRWFAVYVNGTAVARWQVPQSETADMTFGPVVDTLWLEDGDYVEMFIYHEHGASVAMSVGSALTYLTLST